MNYKDFPGDPSPKLEINSQDLFLTNHLYVNGFKIIHNKKNKNSEDIEILL
jgi:hypothetical protein